jgi:hypothetical protein
VKASILRAVDAKRVPMVGAAPGLRDLQVYLHPREDLRVALLNWLLSLEELKAKAADVALDFPEDPTADTEDP